MRLSWAHSALPAMGFVVTTACTYETGEAVETGTPIGAWVAEDIAGGGVIDDLQTTLTLDGNGGATGSGGCNRFNGSAEIAGETLTFGPLAAKEMGCIPAVNDQETKFFAALETVRRWRMENGILFLLDDMDATAVRLAPAS